MDTIEAALRILEADLTKNISLINFLKYNQILNVEIIENSVVAVGVSDRRWVYISCNDIKELSLIKNTLKREDDNFASIDDWIFPVLTKGKEIIWDLCMIQYYLPDDIRLPSSKFNTTPLTESDAQIVFNNSEYKQYISIEYVKDCIRKGISAGLYDNNKLVSWSITQDDGAIGFLHTLDEYRRKGFGFNITLSMIEQVRNNGDLPFANVLPTNKRSIDLLLKLGFKESKRIHWFQIK
jgi:8-oxo-dGTP diphosphatase